MKLCFEQDQVKTADWCVADENNTSQSIIDRVDNFGYPVISKHIFGSRGTGNKKHDNQESLEAWMEGKDLSKYIFEKYYSYNREYRLHISKNGCFYTCRKMLQADAPQDVRWYRNDAHCNWILENNELFDKPVNWDEVIEESVKALKAVGLDIGAVDLRIQSAKNKDGDLRESPKFIVVEINSAASMAEITGQKYIEELPKLLMDKYENL